jgi:transposase
MRIVCALDVHRRQITYAIVDVGSGEVSRGRITPATRESVREWLVRFGRGRRGGFRARGHDGLAVRGRRDRASRSSRAPGRPGGDGGETGGKRRAKTDRADCDLLLRLLSARELPESWIPPAQILELRTRVRLRKSLIDERTAWQQRLQAQRFDQGVPAGLRPRTRAGREALAKVELSPAGLELVALALRMIETIDDELAPLDRALSVYARHQPGCRALIARLYGVGPVTATAIVAELGDVRRFACSDDAVGHCGLDVTVHQSDRKRAAQQACRSASPDYECYRQVARRIDHNRAWPLRRAQALPTRLPHPARARRRGARSDRDARSRGGGRRCSLIPANLARLPVVTTMVCGPLPNGACRQRWCWTASKTERPRSNHGTNTQSIILSPDSLGSRT